MFFWFIYFFPFETSATASCGYTGTYMYISADPSSLWGRARLGSCCRKLWSNGGGLDDRDSSTNLAAVRALFLSLFNGFQQRRFGIFPATVSQWLGHKTCWCSHGLGIYFFLSNGFQQRRFGIFPAAVSQWLGHKTCWGSAFSHARPKHLFLEFGLVACRFFLCF